MKSERQEKIRTFCLVVIAAALVINIFQLSSLTEVLKKLVMVSGNG